MIVLETAIILVNLMMLK